MPRFIVIKNPDGTSTFVNLDAVTTAVFTTSEDGVPHLALRFGEKVDIKGDLARTVADMLGHVESPPNA